MNYKNQSTSKDLIVLKPVSNGQRGRIVLRSSEITHKGKAWRPLTKYIHRKVGINNLGRRTCRTKVRGHKRMYRVIDTQRDKLGIAGKVVRIEYDPFRTANIALIKYIDGEYRYIIAPRNLEVGQELISSNDCLLKPGNTLELGQIPAGNQVHNIEIQPNSGGKFCRAAGVFASVLSHDNNRTKLSLPSKEIRWLSSKCKATIGVVGNILQNKAVVGSAGKNIWRGVKPTVRGSAMNPCDHPHGGGEGKQSIGRHPVNAAGKKVIRNTRSKRKFTNKFIVTSRKVSKW